VNCPQCNHPLPPNAKFCPECGAPVQQGRHTAGGVFPLVRVRTTPEHYVVEVNGRPYHLAKEQVHSAAKTAAAAVGAYLVRRGTGRRGKK